MLSYIAMHSSNRNQEELSRIWPELVGGLCYLHLAKIGNAKGVGPSVVHWPELLKKGKSIFTAF